MWILCLCLALQPAPRKLDRATLIKAARSVRSAIVDAARTNKRSAKPRQGDELTALLVRAAATAVRRLPEGQQGPGFLLGLGVSLDRSTVLRTSIATRSTWHKLESDRERTERLAVLGTPTVHGRHDLAQHFSVSAGLSALASPKSAEATGILKEVLDSRPGGSGFSFADLSANLAGIAVAEQVLARPSALDIVAKRFTVAGFTLSPRGLVEGLTAEQFEKRYGSTGDERFLKELAALKKKVRDLPGQRALAGKGEEKTR